LPSGCAIARKNPFKGSVDAIGGLEKQTNAFVRLRHPVLTTRTPAAMRFLTLFAFSCLAGGIFDSLASSD
jgi:hypothetical protein